MPYRPEPKQLDTMFWLHFPKAGTSFANTILHYACPGLDPNDAIPSKDDLTAAQVRHLTMFWPLWCTRRITAHPSVLLYMNPTPFHPWPPPPPRAWLYFWGAPSQKATYTGSLVELFLRENRIGADGVLNGNATARAAAPGVCRPGAYRDDRLVVSHFPLKRSLVGAGQAVGMFRSPIPRLMSAYNHNLHAFRMGPLSYRKMRSHVKSLAQFAKWPGVSGCQAKMLLGQYCGKSFAKRLSDVPADSVETAVDRIDPTFAFVGLTEHWNMSICLFHAQFGGIPSAASFQNSRAGHYDQAGASSNKFEAQELNIEGIDDIADAAVYGEATRIFVRRLREYGFRVPHFLGLSAQTPRRRRPG